MEDSDERSHLEIALEHIERWFLLRDDVYRNWTGLRALHPHWKLWDVRLTAFEKLASAVSSTCLAHFYDFRYLSDTDWWDRTFLDPFLVSHRTGVVREFRVYWKTAYLNTSLTTLETTLGPITRELDPGAYEELRTSVQKVCNYVLVKAGLDRQWGELVRLIALTRNTGHNNGVHDPPNGRNEQVTFQGRTYDFIVGVSVQWVDSLWLVEMGEQLNMMLRELVEREPILSLGEVRDIPAERRLANRGGQT